MWGEENSIAFSRTSTVVLIQFSSLELISSNVIIFIFWMQQLLSAISDVFLLLPARVSNLERFWQILGILTFFKHIWILKSQMAMVTLGSTRFQWREIQICPPRTHALVQPLWDPRVQNHHEPKTKSKIFFLYFFK